MNFKIIPIKEADNKEKIKIDEFILDENTNGEFINTIKYLSYHKTDRFIDDSIIIKDIDSGVIKSVIMAAVMKDNDINTITSHPGTTFSGLILNRKTNIIEIEYILDLINAYYKDKYNRIILKMAPSYYGKQPNEEIYYTLMKKNYNYSHTALSNIIDLSKIENESKLFESYNSKRRNQIKKPIKKEEFEIFESNDIDRYIWEFMNKNLVEKFNSKTTHDYSEICELKEKFPENIASYVVNNINGEYGAFALVYKFKNVFHTQYLDMNYEISKEYPNLFLVHNLIKIAIKEGFSYFSFGASTENGGKYLNQSLYSYKNEYGGGSILLPKFTNEF